MSKVLRYPALLFSVAFLSCGEKLTEEQLYTKARDFEANAEYSQAQSAYKRFLADFPQSLKTQEVTAKADLIGKAESLAQEKLLEETKAYETSEDLESMLILYNTFLERFPDYKQRDEVLQKLAWCYHNRREFQRAVTTYQRLLTETPQSAHAAQSQFMVGYIYANEIKDLDRARQAYETFQKNFPQHDLSDDVAFELAHLGKDINELEFLSKSQEEPATINATSTNSDNAASERAAKQ
jgi:TolA-binding protein